MDERRRILDSNVELIIERLDDLKDNTSQRFNAIEDKIDKKCLTCPISTELHSQISNIWWHIPKLWTAFVSGMMLLLTIIGSFFLLFWQYVNK